MISGPKEKMKDIIILKYHELEKLLEGIQKPGRYVDHEIGVLSKDPYKLLKKALSVLVCLAFPDIYEIGTPNLGLQILYDIINEQPYFSAERVFAPWTDFEGRLRESSTKLFSLENRIFLDCFDLIGFSLQHELLYTNTLNMLDLGGIEIIAEKRKQEDPLICAGGPAMVNPGPMSRFMDFIVIGDGEEIIIKILERLSKYKVDDRQKGLFLKEISKLDGVYVPSEYKYHYFEDGKIQKIDPPVKVKKAVLADLDSFKIVSSPLIPNIKPVHDRYAVEIMRGCARGCRFCQAGFIYRPVRSRKAEGLIKQAVEGLANTGYDEISFLSLSTSDYKELNKLIKGVLDSMDGENLSISLPSMRLDSFSIEIAELIQKGRKTGLTFAPEAGTQHMRDIINKNITEEEIMDCVDAAFSRGWEKIKLYFMIGFPGEREKDIFAIADLIRKIASRAKKAMSRQKVKRFNMNVSINVFNPKPFTPFQWVAQEEIDLLEKKIHLILDNVPQKHIDISWSNIARSQIECALSRGDMRLGSVIEDAWRSGAKFDNWTDLFDRDAWADAFEKNGIAIDFYTTRGYDTAEILPWDIIDMGVKKEFLLSQYKRALEQADSNKEGE